MSSEVVMEEASKLIGTGKKHLVMGKAVEAVDALLEACRLLAKKYGDTADECGEAFLWCGKALLELARMENSVLGNALEGVPEEEDDDDKEKGQKDEPKDSNFESTENIDEKSRDELRVQVYDAMAAKKDEEKPSAEEADAEKPSAEEADAEKPSAEEADAEKPSAEEAEKPSAEEAEKPSAEEADSEKPSAEAEEAEKPSAEAEEAEKPSAEAEEAEAEEAEKPSAEAEEAEKPSAEAEEAVAEKPKADGEKQEERQKTEPETENESKQTKDKDDEPMKQSVTGEVESDDGEEEEEEGDVEMEEDAEDEVQDGEDTAEKEEEEEEVGNLQMAWEMLEVAKLIYKRKDLKEDQLMAAQAHLKLGEVSVESGNYTQALQDFQECLKLQTKHLDSDSRQLAETHYQLGVTYGLDLQYSLAVEALNSSISVIKCRLGKLQELLDQTKEPEEHPAEKKEMEELHALLPEIQEKVEDATESLKTASTAAEAVKAVLDGASTSGFTTSTEGNVSSSSTIKDTPPSKVSTSTVKVSDISHLVRKRKPEESPVKEGVKKVKQDDAHEPQTNGNHNGHTNGTKV
ncbi:histone-binding protein N1/N2-like isoform X2 [Gouania willdenowi]|uniref:histone-binding protein N1/N2-like isoform X2 n=1 Tax=Gouania willdenowi TaxID=441366 RepID=UPI001054E71B|nr:histone-binding protein N1/N2-like isoform X2 [Gouania willdenowi]